MTPPTAQDTAAASTPSKADLGIGAGLLSLDVFDTTLSRLWAKPSDLFLALGRKLKAQGIDVDPAVIARTRAEAELALRQASPSGECYLLAIHEAMLRMLGLAPERAHETTGIELELEAASVALIAPIAVRAHAAKAQGQHIVYVTDTYLDTQQVHDLLAAAKAPKGPVFASSVLDASKKRGTIFAKVASELKAIPGLHIGDKRGADVKAAEAAGWTAEHFALSRPSRSELRLAGAAFRDPMAASAAGGAAKVARLSCAEPRYAGIAAIGADIVGPVFTAFAGWTIERAAADGVEKLLYLARDGQIVHRLAQALPAGHGVDLVYAYGSRQALYLPAILAVGDPAWSWLEAKAHEVSPADFRRRFGLGDDEPTRAEMAGAGLDMAGPMGPQAGEKAKALFRSEPIAGRVLAQATNRRMAAIAYFRSVIGPSKSVAIVDLGWKGRLQLCIAAILGSDPDLSRVKLKGYYFALLSSSQVLQTGLADTFVGYEKIFNPNLIEVLASADHGSLRGYLMDDAARPILDFDAVDLDAHELGVTVMQDAAVMFARCFRDAADIGAFDLRDALADLKEPAVVCLEQLVHAPTPQEATTLGRFLMSHDTGHAGSREMAPAVATAGIITLAMTGRIAGTVPYWPEGAIARSRAGVPISALAKAVLRLRQRAAGSRVALRRAVRKMTSR